MSAPTRREREVVYEVVHLASLGHVYRRPPFGEYLRQLWERRHFIKADARGRVVSSSRGLALGMGWLVLRPSLDAIAYFVVFALILQADRGIENFIGFLIIGVFLFQFTIRCLTGGSQSLVQGRNLLKAFTFPRASLPVAVVVRETLNAVPMLVTMVVLLLVLQQVDAITWRWLLFPAVLSMQVLFNLGLALWAARVTARFPDVSQLISVLSRFWLYGSAVFFSYDVVLGDRAPTLVTILGFNPMFVVLDISRDLLIYATTPEASSWLILAGWTLLSIVGGMRFFWRAEERYGSL